MKFAHRVLRLACLVALPIATLFVVLPLAEAQIEPVTWTRLSSSTGDLPVPPVSDGQSGLRVVDLDQNGQNDYVITLWSAAETVIWYRHIGDTFERYVIDTETPNLSHGEKFKDIDGDGDIDLLFGDAGLGNNIYWWENPYPNYDPDTPWIRRIVRDTGGNFYHDNIWGDFDDDGVDELIAWNQIGRQLLLFEIPADPKIFGPWPVTQIFSWTGSTNKYRGADAVDMDFDGKIDFVGGGGWFEHTGGTNFTFHPIDDAMGYSQIKAGQLIPGGRPEVVCVLELSAGPLNMYEWTGSEWQTHTLLSNVPRSHTLQLGDVNSDGYLDIMTGEMGQWSAVGAPPDNPDAKISVLYGDGNGNFTQQVVFEGQGDLEGQLADIGNDGGLDIVAKPWRHNIPRVDIYINQGLTPTVDVPDFLGISQAEAETAIAAAGLIVGTVSTVYSDTIPVGEVISQKPVAGFIAVIGWPVDLVVSSGTGSYQQEFESYAANEDPEDWLDTGANNSLVEDDSLFKVFDLSGEKAFGTTSSQTNIHSHYIGPAIDPAFDYEYTGRMMITEPGGGIGVTFLSQYPTSDAYYRLRRYGNNSFHISSHGTGVSGVTDTEVIPLPNQWYRFRIQVEDTGTRTEIRARVWLDSESEPAFWRVNAYDDNPTRLIAGTIGVWGYQTGGKFWDNLVVGMLGQPPVMLNVPDVVALSQVDAETDIVAAGLSVGTITTANSDTVPAGDVISQDPLAGTAVPSGSAVDIVVSLGPLEMVDVPDVVGISQADAEADIVAAGLSVGTVTTANSDTVTAGNVISQNPISGTAVPSGSTVNIVVSLGPLEMVDVPDVVGISQADAEADIVAAGLSVGTVTTANSDTVPAGDVISQDPVAGAAVLSGSAVDIVVSSGTAAYQQDFEGYTAGEDPADWLDTGANSSLLANDSLFKVFDLSGEKAFGTLSTATNIHSHYVGGGIGVLSGYEYTGRMMITASGGGIGVTFFSEYPLADVYYRLRRYASKPTFHLAPHGTSVSGNKDTGVVPLVSVWYQFKIQVEDTGTQTEIRAKVWPEGDSEPVDWQAEAYDVSPTRLTAGTIGLWSMGSGNKYWDDLTAYALGSPPEMVDVPDVVGSSQADAEAALVAAGLSVGTVTAASSDTVPAGDVISQDPVAGASVPAGSAVDLVVSSGTAAYQQDFESYSAGEDPLDWLDTGENNSLLANDTLFEVFDLSGEKAFGTPSTATNIHSHYVGGGIDSLSGYEFTGRMMITASGSGIGVTFFSEYPLADAYYRLRRYASRPAFHLASHDTSVSGDKETGVVAVANVWYRFRIQVEDTGTQTEIRARVWAEGESEPADWLAEAYDGSPTRLTTGIIGLWSMGSGNKYWDDLAVVSLLP